MKIKQVLMCLFLVWFGWLGLAQEDAAAFDRAKIHLFDKNWDKALKELNYMLENYPDSRYYQLALFYRGKCHEENKSYIKASVDYETYLTVSTNENLREEANIALININFELYKGGGKKYLQKLLLFLDDPVKTVRYYAAFKLSYLKEKRVAKRAVTVLKDVIKNEKDEALQNRAKIALMRIDPNTLKEDTGSEKTKAKFIKIQITHKKSGKTRFEISIPFDLARLALESLPDSAKKALKKKNYNIDRIIRDLTLSGEIFKFDQDGQVVKIWIQ